MKGFLNRLALSVTKEAMAPHTQLLHQHLRKPPPFSHPLVHSPLKQPAMAAVHHSQAAGVHLFSSWTVKSPVRSSSVQRHGLPQLDLGFVSHCMRLGTAQCTHTEAFHLSRDDSTTCGEDFLPGSIHLIMGPMFAGKTTALLKRVQAEARLGRNVAVVKSEKDTRYGLADIVSHDGIRMPCWAVPNLASFKSKLGEKAYAKLDVIGIDEAQFLKDLYTFCQVAADVHGKTVIVAGLDGDFLRNRFGTILDLVPLADSVVKLSSHCELCGKPALFTFRKTDDKSKEVIGGADVYMPVCRQHYLSGQSAHETARTILSPRQVDHYHALL